MRPGRRADPRAQPTTCVRGKIDAHFVDLGDKGADLKNVVRPVRVYAGLFNTGSEISPTALSLPLSREEEVGRHALSIVVLPFANIGGDPEHVEHFVDGVTESLTTDLSRIRGAVVIARNTAFTYKGRRLDVKSIGRELNIRYVLEGSVQRGGNRMRINVQLIDAESGDHLWAERFDKLLADLFDMQDEIVARLAGALNTELAAAEARRAGTVTSSNPDSMDLYFQGMACLQQGSDPWTMWRKRASSYFDRALAADPDNIDSLIGSARADVYAGVASFVTDPAVASRGGRETEIDQSLVGGPGPCACALVLGICRHIHQTRRRGHRRM